MNKTPKLAKSSVGWIKNWYVTVTQILSAVQWRCEHVGAKRPPAAASPDSTDFNHRVDKIWGSEKIIYIWLYCYIMYVLSFIESWLVGDFRELYYVICCDTMWYYVMLYYTMLYYLVLCYTMLYYVLLYLKVPCYTTLVLSRDYHAMWDVQCCVCQQYSKNISVWIILSPVCISLSYTSNIYRSYWSNWFQETDGFVGCVKATKCLQEGGLESSTDRKRCIMPIPTWETIPLQL